MKSRNLSKTKFFYECLVEKFMEWFDALPYLFRREEAWVSNLIECYSIYEEYAEQEYVKDFIESRKKILSNNRYKMTVETLRGRAPERVIGKVTLYRKRKYIHEATLKKKEGDCNNLIYWSFEKR